MRAQITRILLVAVLASGMLVAAAAASPAATSQTIAAGSSDTNLPTESRWPGSQNPPYVCCWSKQGQYVTFTFDVAGGSTDLALRYSAGSGAAKRKLELDGAVWVAAETFASTTNWSTWATVTLNTTLSAGTHTLKVWFDSTSGSTRYLNLDNLTVTQLAPPPPPPPPAAPTNSDPPTITGVAQAGSTLTASPGTWTGSPDTFSFAYQWNRCTPDCVATSDTTASYLLTGEDVGATLTLTVVASNSTGSSAPVTSAPTSVITTAPVTETIAANASDTNLPTESRWPGSQDPPYVCCWSKQGQYVTFSFTAGDARTDLALRYSAGGGAAVRTLEMDGGVWVAAQTFPATSSWSSWTTLTLTTSLSAGPHTLTLLFDSASGSSHYLNLDNLKVSPIGLPPDGVVVSLGYADSATGLTPWAGSSGTTFIGEAPQCCATHGADNGSPGYDSGAIEINNTSTSSVVVDSVSVDFGGGSRPSTIALWASGQGGSLPMTLPPGDDVVLTMTSGFNFDGSDLLGEACHPNTGVVPVVHVGLNGTLTDYLDSNQILNAGGADLASCPGDVSEQAPFTTVFPGSQPVTAPVNRVPPAVVGTAAQNRVLSGIAGDWSASPPPTLAMQWLRCDAGGLNCVAIPGAQTPTYRPSSDDVGSTLRFAVTASNGSGEIVMPSSPTAVVLAGNDLAQLGNVSTGFSSIEVSKSTEIGSRFTASAGGTAIDFEFYARGAAKAQGFTPKLYEVAAGVKTLLGTGASITVPRGTDGQWYTSALPATPLVAGAQYYLALDPSGASSGTYVGSETDGTLSVFVDYTP
jgi:hypothetical protein